MDMTGEHNGEMEMGIVCEIVHRDIGKCTFYLIMASPTATEYIHRSQSYKGQ